MKTIKIGSWVALSEYSTQVLSENGSVISKSAMIHPSLKLCHPIHLSPGAQIKNDVRIDKFSFVNWNSIIYPNVSIGAYCSIGRGVEIGLAVHPIDWLSSHSFQYGSSWFPDVPMYQNVERKTKHRHHQPTSIGSDVWIGNKAMIMSGVKVGHGAVIGAGAVVTKDVEPYSIVAGVPAKHLKYRFDSSVIQRLIAAKWWLLNPDALSGVEFSNIQRALDVLENRGA